MEDLLRSVRRLVLSVPLPHQTGFHTKFRYLRNSKFSKDIGKFYLKYEAKFQILLNNLRRNCKIYKKKFRQLYFFLANRQSTWIFLKIYSGIVIVVIVGCWTFNIPVLINAQLPLYRKFQISWECNDNTIETKNVIWKLFSFFS